MAQRQILQTFDTYQKARTAFVQTVANLSNRPENIAPMQEAGVLALLRPLLLDSVPSIQQSAAIALGRLANSSDELAGMVVTGDILPQLVYSLSEQHSASKKAAAYVLRTVAKHSPELAQAVVDAGAVDALVMCLNEFNPLVKESAAWALGYIARHTADLAQAVVDAGAIPLLILCIQEPEVSLKRIAASALSDIAKHSPDLAQSVADGGAIAYLSQCCSSPDSQLKRQVFAALSQIARHSVELAELVVEAYIFPAAYASLKDPDEYVRKNVASLVREVAKHTPELAQLIVNSGGVMAIVDYVENSRGSAVMPGVVALGYIGALSELLAKAVIDANGVPALAKALSRETDYIRAACCWSLGQIGKHTPEHARKVAGSDVPRLLLQFYMDEGCTEDERKQASRALKNILQKCTHMPALQSLLQGAPPDVLEHVVGQFAKILPTDAKARREFVTSGALKRIQEIHATDGPIREAVEQINECFPEEIVQYYSPGYSDTLLQRLDGHQQPQPANL